jgi:hypothetical protein
MCDNLTFLIKIGKLNGRPPGPLAGRKGGVRGGRPAWLPGLVRGPDPETRVAARRRLVTYETEAS